MTIPSVTISYLSEENKEEGGSFILFTVVDNCLVRVNHGKNIIVGEKKPIHLLISALFCVSFGVGVCVCVFTPLCVTVANNITSVCPTCIRTTWKKNDVLNNWKVSQYFFLI